MQQPATEGGRGRGRPAGSGTPPAARPVPPKPVTAAAQLAALAEQRRRNDGFLVAPPMPLEQLAKARMLHPEPGSNETLAKPNAELRAVLTWWEAIVAAGGTQSDLQAAWDRWNPEAVGPSNPKRLFAAQFQALKAQTHGDLLHAQAEREALPARQLASARAALSSAVERAAKAREELAKLDGEVERVQAAITRLEKEQRN